MVNRKIDSQNNGTDTEGHGIRIRPGDQGRTIDDAIGHMPPLDLVEDTAADESDTEGNGARFHPKSGDVTATGSADDAEGHALKFRP